jgi:hypothetical protein
MEAASAVQKEANPAMGLIFAGFAQSGTAARFGLSRI